MDNRSMTVTMKPRGRRRVVVSTDLVTGAMNGFTPNLDHFSIPTIVGSPILKNVAAGGATGAVGGPVGAAVGAGAGLLKGIFDIKKNKEAAKAAANNPAGNMADWEGQLIRVARDKVYQVKNGKAEYVSKLPLPDGRSWESVKEVASMPLTGSVVKVTSVTPQISPLPPSVPMAPGDANIFAAIQATGQSMSDKITQAVQGIPVEQQRQMLAKAQQIYDSGGSGILTKAQKALQNATMGILPKTREVKNAEAILTAPQFGGPSPQGSSLSFTNPWVIGGIVAAIIGIIIVVAIKK